MKTWFLYILIAINIQMLQPQKAGAEVIKDIIITGNDRTGSDIIISKLNIKVGQNISKQQLNEALKRLYTTEYFADISLSFDNKSVLQINVLENPIVAGVYITGDSKIDSDDIKRQLSTQPLQTYSKNKIKFDMEGLYSVYQRMGYMNINILPKVVFLDENAVDIIFHINEGEPSYVRQINFHGNNHYTDFSLSENIYSQKRLPLAFTRTSGSFVQDNLERDKELLKHFYHSRGYARMDVVNYTAGFDKEQFGFVLDFFIEEGEKYNFGNITINSKFDNFNNNKEILQLIETKTGKEYNIDKIQQSLIKISNYLGEQGYANVKPTYKLQINNKDKTVDVIYTFNVSQKLYIDKITISGNTKTQTNVILRELTIDEGDLYNSTSIMLSKDKLIMLGYFKSVDIKEYFIPNSDLVALEIVVEEQFSGQVNLSLGYSNYFGLTGQINLQIQNFLGRGYNAGISLDKNGYTASGRINFFDPYFFGKYRIGFGISLYGSYFGDLSFGDTKYLSNIPYKGYSFGGDIMFNFELMNRLNLSVDIGYSNYKYLQLASYGYRLYNQLMGSRQNTYIALGITWNKANRARYSTKGFILQGNITFAGFGLPKQQQFIKYTGQFMHNLQLYGENLILHTEIMGGYVQNIGTKNQIIGFENMFSLGGYQMRGFNFYGIGANIYSSAYNSYMTYAIDSTKYYYATIELRTPLFIPKDYGIYLSGFVDIGAAWGFSGNSKYIRYDAIYQGITLQNYNYEMVVESWKPRISAGVGITWNSPMGAIGVYYAKPLYKQKYDMTMEFGLKVGTQFL